MKPNYIPDALNYKPGLCKEHLQPDCGCSGYPTLQERLIDCGDPTCYDGRRWNTCLQHQAANMIERYKVRSERYLERIMDLQEMVDRYEQIRVKIIEAWDEQLPPWDKD